MCVILIVYECRHKFAHLCKIPSAKAAPGSSLMSCRSSSNWCLISSLVLYNSATFPRSPAAAEASCAAASAAWLRVVMIKTYKDSKSIQKYNLMMTQVIFLTQIIFLAQAMRKRPHETTTLSLGPCAWDNDNTITQYETTTELGIMWGILNLSINMRNDSPLEAGSSKSAAGAPRCASKAGGRDPQKTFFV